MAAQMAAGFFPQPDAIRDNGTTIEEKTRRILGWTEPNSRKMKKATSRAGPYNRSRRNSEETNPVLKQQLTPPPSPSIYALPRVSPDSSYGSLPVSPTSTGSLSPLIRTDSAVFDRLRELVPHIPADRNAYQTLIKTVMGVIELEHKLEALKQETEGVRTILTRQKQLTSPLPKESPPPSLAPWEHTVPEDLAGIDVSAFKSLVSFPHQWAQL